ncbi:MAG TPA: MerR family transcriptional regulator [Burkholderiales bacterium]|nr:MerR family transcriptional regulator [Burkholderiales bacterium]
MQKEDILLASLVEYMTIEEAASVCRVDVAWLSRRIEEGCFPGKAERFSPGDLKRARRMRDIERDFDASPELAALVADLLDELDELRRK